MATGKTKPSSAAAPPTARPRSSSSLRSADSLAGELVVVREELRRVDARHASLTRAHSHMRQVVVVTAFVLVLYAVLLFSASTDGR